jgi:nucleotide-binding universal stress UspA family protein
MTQKILIALDDSENALRAVSYVAANFQNHAAVTLFSVLSDTASLCDMNSPELTPLFKAQQSSFCQLEDKKRSLVNAACEKGKQILCDAGWDPAYITLKAQPKRKGIARDIIQEASQGYDLIVIGKHGVSGIRDFFLGSIPQKVLQLAKEVSLLIIN